MNRREVLRAPLLLAPQRILEARAAGEARGRRSGGVFSPVIAESTPFLLVLFTHPSFAAVERSPDLDFDYIRYERTILRAFSAMPKLKPAAASKNGHVFELRTYESGRPHLTCMLAHDDLAARDRLWKDFGADPEWQRLRFPPGLSDADIVSNISNSILRPASISDIR